MSVSLLPPDLRRIFTDLQRRVGILERRVSTSTSATGSSANDDIIFSYSGNLTATESPPVKLRYGGFLATISIALGTVGSASTTLEVKRNGTTVATVVVPSGAADYGAAIGTRVFGEDRISLEIVTPGTGAANMTAAARFT